MLANSFENVFPVLSTREQKVCIQFVRDKISPLVGEPEIMLLDNNTTVEFIYEHLAKSGLGTPQNIADKHIVFLKNEKQTCSVAENCAIDLLLSYFESFCSAKLAIGATSNKAIETMTKKLDYSARQLALLYCSGTKKVDIYAH